MNPEREPETRSLRETGFLADFDDLPQVPGGWTSQDVVVGSRRLDLTLPADPNEFLGDQQTLATGPDDDDYVPYWPHLWPASVQMAEIIQRAEWHAGTPALELGCGVGLVGLAGLASGLDVTFSDYEPTALQLVQHNAGRNGLTHPRTLLLDWKHPEPRRFPVILASEVLYETRHHRPLLGLLESMLEPNGECWIGDAGRQVAAPFVELARQHRYSVQLYDEDGLTLESTRVGRFQLMTLRKLGVS